MAITRVQSKTATSGGTNGTSLALTFDSTPTAGNTLVIAAACTGTTSLLKMADQTGLTWLGFTGPINNGTQMIFVGRVASSIASATVTLTSPASQALVLVGAEYHGTNMRPDKAVSASGNSASPASGATETTSNANELWVGAISVRGTNANTIGTYTNSFTEVGQTNTTNGTTNNDRTVALTERIVTSTGTANSGATVTSNFWVAVALTFEETPTAAASGGSYTFGG